MIKVLWLSRHPLEKEAIEALESHLQKLLTDEYRLEALHNERLEVTQINFTFSPEPEKAVEELKKLVEEYDPFAVGGVFPAQLYVGLIKELQKEENFIWMPEGPRYSRTKSVFEVIGVPVFTVVSAPIAATDDGEVRKFAFHHIEWL